MTMPTEGTPPPLSGTPIPVPAYFRHAEPGFSLKRPGGLSRSLPPRPPAKGCIPVSRLFPPRTPGWHQPQPRRVSFLCETSEPLQSPGYDPSRPESFFQQNFQRLSRLGHGSYGEVFKVRSKEDGRLYAVKRYMSPFRGPKDRTRKLAEALVTLLCWLWHGLVHPASWLQPPGPPATPPGSPPCSPLLDSTLSSSWDNDSIGPSLSPETVLSRITRRTSTPRGRYIPRDALDLTDVDSEPPRGPCPTFEPRNLLSLFEDSLDPA